MNKREVRRKLTRIKRLVEGTHWTKGHYHTHLGGGKPGFCLVGMIMEVTHDAQLRRDLRALLNETIQEYSGYQPSIESWNDSPHRRVEDVLRVVDRSREKVERAA